MLKAAAEKCGVKLEHALELTADLDNPSVKDAFLQRKHHLDVFVAGTQDVIDQKRGEIQSYMERLEEKGYLKSSQTGLVGGLSGSQSSSPIQAQGKESLVMLLDAAKETQPLFREHERARIGRPEVTAKSAQKAMRRRMRARPMPAPGRVPSRRRAKDQVRTSRICYAT